MRMDKFLVDCGIGSRTEVKAIIKAGRVKVNGKKQTSAKFQVKEASDEVAFDGQVLTYEHFVYYLLNKPKGVISATEDEWHKTVLDLLDDTARQKEVFPVGRLDIDTHGLLFLTNNGKLAHAMLSPKRHVDKVYHAKIAGIMTEEDQKRFYEGIQLKDFKTLPANLTIINIDVQTQTSWVEITITEGKFHQVKRMVASCGKEVVDLKRVCMGELILDDLELGDFRRLTESEMESLQIYGVEL